MCKMPVRWCTLMPSRMLAYEMYTDRKQDSAFHLKLGWLWHSRVSKILSDQSHYNFFNFYLMHVLSFFSTKKIESTSPDINSDEFSLYNHCQSLVDICQAIHAYAFFPVYVKLFCILWRVFYITVSLFVCTDWMQTWSSCWLWSWRNFLMEKWP